MVSFTLRLPDALAEELDRQRGLAPRNAWIVQALSQHLGLSPYQAAIVAKTPAAKRAAAPVQVTAARPYSEGQQAERRPLVPQEPPEAHATMARRIWSRGEIAQFVGADYPNPTDNCDSEPSILTGLTISPHARKQGPSEDDGEYAEWLLENGLATWKNKA